MPPSSKALAGIVVCACAWLTAPGVYAHPVPALPPDFGMPECITVVDKRTTEVVPLDYFVGYDDVMEEPDHIPVADQKTHQFFAFRGQLTGQDPTYHYWPFDPTMTPHIEMPVWIDQADLLACDAKNTPEIAPQFSSTVIGTDTLTDRPELAGQWLDVRQERVPITERQALLGMRWPLASVPAGVYQIIGYIYSPPYNAWEARPGVIKVIDGTRDVPALTVSSVDAMLFEGQGRKISGCVNAPAGTELRAFYRATETPNAPWEMWATQPVDETGKYELCYRSPEPGFSGILEIRIVAVGPDGEQTAAYAPDNLVLVPNAANCTESAKLCCDATAMQPAAAGAAGVAGAAAAAAAPSDISTAGTGTLTQPTQAAPAMATAPRAPASGCSCVTQPAGADLWGACLMLLMAAGFRARRRNTAVDTCD
jgi:MYXO-CTERM domain-containing protein